MQIMHASRRGSRDIEHVGSAHDEAGVAALRAAAWQRLAAGVAKNQTELSGPSGPR